MIVEAIYKVISGEDLEYETARAAMEEIMEGKATQAQIAAFLTALRMKGESIDEITACAFRHERKGNSYPAYGRCNRYRGYWRR